MTQSTATTTFIQSLLKLTRFWNLVIIGLAQYFTAWFLIGHETVFDHHLFLLSFSTLSIAAAGYIINDYHDIKIDLINKPERVVVGKSITRRYAILFHVMLSGMGVLVGIFISLSIGFLNFVSAFVLWLYSLNLKRQPFVGNFAVAMLTGLSILIVDILFRSDYTLVLIYSVFAFFITLIREIIKDMEDLKGDDTFGCKTLPIVYGMRKTKIVIYILVAVFAIIVLVLNQLYVKLPIYYFFIFLFVPLLVLVARLYRADMVKDYAWLSNFCKVIMLLGILSMAFV